MVLGFCLFNMFSHGIWAFASGYEGDRIHTGATGLGWPHALPTWSHFIETPCFVFAHGNCALFEHTELMLTKQATYIQSSEDAISMGLGLAALLVSTWFTGRLDQAVRKDSEGQWVICASENEICQCSSGHVPSKCGGGSRGWARFEKERGLAATSC